ncbi:hypothetical protein HK103_006037 [Boothiomyces macroporosus]|uniref:UspA domain-containing protein n=1 Tax=Boothiomyces macroporosus TaxID=261099 RepID=A0AAD5Y2D5_9FUNG|nr:hypothetical protein HK103_006037 [Boothiomyces macroporosus]
MMVEEYVEGANDLFNATRTILIPVDHSEYSIHAVEWAIQNWINPKTDRVFFVFCRQVDPPAAFLADADLVITNATTYNGFEAANEESKQDACHMLKAYSDLIKQAGIHHTCISLIGNPKEELLNWIEKHNPTLVVMGNRGLGAIKKMFLGSVSQYLLDNAKVPITIVPLKCQ